MLTLLNTATLDSIRENKSVRSKYESRLESRGKNLLHDSFSNSKNRSKSRYDMQSKSENKKERLKTPQTEIDPMSRNYKSLMRMNNTTAAEKNEPNKANLLRNVFTDYTAGCNLSEYREVLSNSKAGNGTVQWVLHLRQRFEEKINSKLGEKFISVGRHSKYHGFSKPPSCYYADDQKSKVHKTVSDINYKGNTLDIIHGLKYKALGCRELQQMASLRSFYQDETGNSC